MEEVLKDRLEILDAEIHTVMVRQGLLLGAIASLATTQSQANRIAYCSDKMIDALDDLCKKVEIIIERKEKARGKDLGTD